MTAEQYAWQDYALCAQMDPELWFRAPQDGGKYSEIKAWCRECPVLTECRLSVLAYEWGLRATERRGVWGAMTPADRFKTEQGLRAQGTVIAA